MTFADIVKLGGMALVCFIFVNKMDSRLEKLESEHAITAQSVAKMIDFVKNSDGFHSAITGAQFENGRPLNSGFEIKKIREYIAK